jgi:hypothetical protein
MLALLQVKKAQILLRRMHHLSTWRTYNMLEKYEDPVQTNREKWHQ